MKELPREDWWTPQQMALVEDRSRRWRLKSFEPSDAAASSSEGQRVLRAKQADEEENSGADRVPGGWDHEHCTLYWQRLSLSPGDERAGYTDGRDWLCQACYEKFILPRTAVA